MPAKIHIIEKSYLFFFLIVCFKFQSYLKKKNTLNIFILKIQHNLYPLSYHGYQMLLIECFCYKIWFKFFFLFSYSGIPGF